MPKFVRNGVELHYELDGSGAPAVYISGFGAHSNDMLASGLRAALGPHYRLLMVDNRGSGQSPVAAGTTATIDDLADDIAAILEQNNMTPAHVLGISMGGCIAMTLALRHPDKVRSLVSAVSLAGDEYPNRSGFLLETGRAMQNRGVPLDLLNRYNTILVLGESVFKYGDLIDGWISGPPDPLAMNQAGYDLQKYALEHYDIRARLAQITAPTLIISSSEDVLVPPHYQYELAAKIPGAQLKRYPGGHVFMMLPPYAASFAEDVLRFWGAH